MVLNLRSFPSWRQPRGTIFMIMIDLLQKYGFPSIYRGGDAILAI
jgi:hypothetical protein